MTATGHVFNYVYNEDATYLADGTETATCVNCDETDTRTAEGTMLTYTYTDMSAAKYANQTVNIRTLPYDTRMDKTLFKFLTQHTKKKAEKNGGGYRSCCICRFRLHRVATAEIV